MSSSTPTFDLTIGAIVVSTFFSFLTMGIIVTVACQYYFTYPKDPLVFKGLVTSVLALSIMDTVADGYWCYDWTVHHYMDPTILAIIPVSLIVEFFCIGASTLIVQMFFAWRVWNVSHKRNWMIPAFICTMSLLSLCIILYGMSIWANDRAMAHVGNVLPAGYAWLAGSVVADISISASMIYYLSLKFKAQHIIPASQSIFNRIITRTIQANLLSLVSQVTTFILFKANVGFYFVFNDFMITKTYAFSLIMSLNMRSSGSKSTGSSSNAPSIPLSNISFPNKQPRQGDPKGITVHRTVDVAHDKSWQASNSHLELV
ncbi:hypothetical protein K435DRAFT_964136 [Dendrothele bispora CBS 962.96]|uniref:DUF6534 domain-containing protein n=1 Tax=Dendrothele bispora (strain CBS 962.96) TaxID=1314807 RepID=A0A4S8MCY2_DENBC|nr:hypothetical protein K435DRAFT_964136 [Dendrothele bispora CBS 962.96]